VANVSVKREVEAAPPIFSCEVAAWNVARLNLAELVSLRKNPAERLPPHITAQFLKNSDDQTLASLVAIYAGIENLNSERAAYRDWGIVSASQYIGRGSFAATLHKYCKDGPWGVSVQVIPHNMLHSISSTISLTLPCFGPCLGAGGGINGEMDALLIATNLLAGGQIPGVWVTWSIWDPELVIDEAGKPKSDSTCMAVAMALVPETTSEPPAQLELRLADPAINSTEAHSPHSVASPGDRALSLTNALRFVCEMKPASFQVLCPLKGGLQWRLVWRPPNGAPENIDQNSTAVREGTDASI